MERKITLLTCCFLFHALFIFSQCIDRNNIWKRIVFLRDSSTIPTKDQLSELLKYESIFTAFKYKTDSTRTLLLQRIGVNYYKLSDFNQAEKYINSSIKIIYDSAGKSFINPGQLGRSYYSLALIYDSLNKSLDHLKAEDSCISASIRTGTFDIFLLYSIKKKVEYLYYTGDYQNCINYAQEGESITPKIIHTKDSLEYLSEFMTWKVNSLIQIRNFDEAEILLEEKMSESKIFDLSNYLGVIYERLASIKIQKSKYAEALYYYNKSLACDKKKKNYLGCLETCVNMGFYLYHNSLNDNKNAIRSYNNAIYFASLFLKNASEEDSNQARIQLLNIYNNIADIYVKTGFYDSAQYFFKKAFSQINIDLDNSNIYEEINNEVLENKSFFHVAHGLLDVGEASLKEYKSSGNKCSLQKAARIFTIVDKLQFQNGIEQTDAQSKLFWKNELRRLYENGIETFYFLGNQEAAFQFFEKSRATLLNDQLSIEKTLNTDDLFNLAQVKKKILLLSLRLTKLNASSIQYKSLQNDLFTSQQELHILEQSIKTKYPLYYQTRVDTSSLNLKNIQNILAKDQAEIIELFNGDSTVYVLKIASKQILLSKVEKNDFDKTVYLYTSYISDAAVLNKEYDRYLQTAIHLFELIFQNTSLPKGRIIVSPDGKYFPFEALVTNKNYSFPVYFLNDYIVSYTYSARFLLNDFKINVNSSTGNFLGVAPVQYPATFHLSSLPLSDVSLEKMSAYFKKANNITSSLATKNNFLNQFPGYKIIQLYTHASDSSSNGEPVIYFADSALYLSELIPEKKTATQLIVLSACETGNGKLYKGEGVFSFNRGFASLGIPSSVINLWAVDNESTYKLTELFYKYVSQGIPLDISLQKAKLEFISTSSKNKRMPYYWAAAIIAGKTDSVNIGKSVPWLVIIIAGILVTSLVFFLRFNKRWSKENTN